MIDQSLECKPWARMRKHGPCLIWDWHATYEDAAAAIKVSVEKGGLRSIQTIAYFPDETSVPVTDEEMRLQEPSHEAMNRVQGQITEHLCLAGFDPCPAIKIAQEATSHAWDVWNNQAEEITRLRAELKACKASLK